MLGSGLFTMNPPPELRRIFPLSAVSVLGPSLSVSGGVLSAGCSSDWVAYKMRRGREGGREGGREIRGEESERERERERGHQSCMYSYIL